jgi:hypothetical protein
MRKIAGKCQKVIWHLRWILLMFLMAFNVYEFINKLDLHLFLSVNGFSFALYLLLGQLEGYFACKSNCRL